MSGVHSEPNRFEAWALRVDRELFPGREKNAQARRRAFARDLNVCLLAALAEGDDVYDLCFEAALYLYRAYDEECRASAALRVFSLATVIMLFATEGLPFLVPPPVPLVAMPSAFGFGFCLARAVDAAVRFVRARRKRTRIAQVLFSPMPVVST